MKVVAIFFNYLFKAIKMIKIYLFACYLILATAGAVVAQSPAPASGGDIKVYNNYDFVPGDKVIFEDHFTNDQDGEFPAQWKLNVGAGVMNKVDGINTFVITDGNYASVSPRIKTNDYLNNAFTIEFDYFVPKNGNYGNNGPVLRLKSASKYVDLRVDGDANATDNQINTKFPGDHTRAVWRNKWHHVAIAFKDNQLKMYVDQYRVLVNPDSKIATPAILNFCCIATKDMPFIFTNMRIAQGGGMNIIGKKFTDAKIVTHGINFDYDKATLKPESMGTLNMIQKIMTGDLDVKFEVGGHTDGDGDAAYNLKLSQQRADAVRSQLIAMGIDGARLTAKGYGKTKPIADNTTEDGKANNRRVEFVKK